MTTKIITESDLLAAMRAQANDKAMGMPHAFSERDVAYVWFRLPVLPDSGDLETAVSNALSAATEGGDYTEAPDPSDEPGSPYVKHIAASLAASGVSVTPAPDAERLRAALRALIETYHRDMHGYDEVPVERCQFAHCEGVLAFLAAAAGGATDGR